MSHAETEVMARESQAWRSPEDLPEETDTMVMPLPSDRPTPRPRSISRVTRSLASSSGVWAGLALAMLGFGTIFFAWIKVAGLVNVALQMPYVVSGGLTGVALVIVGMTVVDVSVRRQDSHERRQQLAQMSRVLDELRDMLEVDDSYRDQER